ncbi:MAG TPA: DUF2167 domain-containing protein [Acetobacteraceae bacterium]|nr:DUF2167 domain-containing protein [Acetobacteraceae bacterium]
MPPNLRLRTIALVAALSLAAWPNVVSAQGFDPATGATPQTRSAVNDALHAATGAPAAVDLAGEGRLRISGPELYVPPEQARQILAAMGLDIPPDLVGVVIGSAALDSIGVMRFVRTGFVKADDIDKWTADDLLASLRDATAETNVSRADHGLPTMVARRWLEPPTYDASAHQLVWAPMVVPAGAPSETVVSAVYSAAAFGRDGYFLIQFETTSAKWAERTKDAAAILNDLRFLPGKGYQDFTANDPVAAHGLERLLGVTRFRSKSFFAGFWQSDLTIPGIAGAGLVLGALLIWLRSRRSYRRR